MQENLGERTELPSTVAPEEVSECMLFKPLLPLCPLTSLFSPSKKTLVESQNVTLSAGKP
jgi:hypothetical protein